MKNDSVITLNKREITKLECEIKQATSSLSKVELDDLVNKFLDQVIADPGNPVLRAKASIAASVWNGRYK